MTAAPSPSASTSPSTNSEAATCPASAPSTTGWPLTDKPIPPDDFVDRTLDLIGPLTVDAMTREALDGLRPIRRRPAVSTGAEPRETTAPSASPAWSSSSPPPSSTSSPERKSPFPLDGGRFRMGVIRLNAYPLKEIPKWNQTASRQSS